MTKEAAVSCGVCLDTFTSNLKVLECGHVLCDECWKEYKAQKKTTCPYCRQKWKGKPYELFPELTIVDGDTMSPALLETRQRVVRMINNLNSMSSVQDIRQAYLTAREHRAAIRNVLSDSNDKDLKTWALAITDAVDALEDRLHYSLQKQDLINKVKEKDQQLRDRIREHEEGTAELINTLESLQRKFDSQEQEQKRVTSKLADYKQKYQQSQSQLTMLTAKANETSAAAEDRQKQLIETQEQNKTFQEQLHRHKIKGHKQKAQIQELKREIEKLKREQEKPRPNPPTTPALGTVPLAQRPHNVPQSKADESLEIIELSSSSPEKTALSPVVPKKRPRAPDENQYPHPAHVELLPPPKFRNPGSSRIRHEVVQKVHIAPKDDNRLKRAVQNYVSARQDLQTSHKHQMPKADQLGLGQGGKLVTTGTKRRVRAT
ncbi:hypothetical protein CPB86DRAFT_845488 [Serendipita vermifera]|nr:hypothetical protein CPB86DRAFT_845488 [Serendipita vermifera]